MNLAQQNIKWMNIAYFVFGTTLLLVLAFGVVVNFVQAQSTENWSDPTNLSQSGSASDPVMVIDSDGVFHVLWLDEFAGLVYSSSVDGIEWSAPIPARHPSKDIVPFLIADKNGYIHALWRGTEFGRLFYSRTRASAFSKSSTWSPRELISDSVLTFDVALDNDGDLHLAYLNPEETALAPAGVYYRRLRDGSSNWIAPTLLYASPYFRSLDLTNSNVDVAASTVGEDTRIFVAWDNRPRERIFLASSDDDGKTWTIPEVVDQPQPGVVGSGPSNIQVYVNGDQVMLTWRVGEQDTACNQYYQWSQDWGEIWSLHQPIYTNTPICLEEVQIVPDVDHAIMMGRADQVYFLAWDGERWSDPQLEEPLTAYIDPDTQNPVQLGCKQLTTDGSNTLFLVGCDDGLGSDVWSLKRTLLDVGDWFPSETGWSTMENVDSVEVRVASPKIKYDKQDRAHLFWSQAGGPGPESLGKSIFYSVRQDGHWSPSAEILSSPIGKAEQVSVAINSDDKLFVVWSGGLGGEVFFSHADANQAFVPSSWSEPTSLPAPVPVGSSPDIVSDTGNNIYVTYAVPLNEQRGIYITTSNDSGQTWTDPVRVFDAQSASWDMVDNPHLTLTKNGHLHMIWIRYSLPSGTGPLELYYARSEDGGASWTIPQLVEEGPVTWSQIVGVGDNKIQRVWQQESSSGTTLWHEQSTDEGRNWDRIAPVSIFGDILGNPSLTSDQAGRLHLLLVVRSGIDSYILQHWIFDGQSWIAESSNSFQFLPETEIDSIVSDNLSDASLGVVLLNNEHPEFGNHQYNIFYTEHTSELPEIDTINFMVATPTPGFNPTPLSTGQESRPTQTRVIGTPTPIIFPEDPANSGTSDWIVILGPVGIGLIVLVLVIVVVRWLRE
jgi:hypothetical protein